MTHFIPQDDKERIRALDPTQSFIVQAPAGSGKTELLTQRFLNLLNHVKTPEEILAITFTKKSAHEMRARIINTLKKAIETKETPELPHAKKTWELAQKVLARDTEFNWKILSNPNRLHIQTIDSFNVHLTKYLPILSQFGATPNITENAEILYEEAVEDFLSHLEENLEWSNAIADLLLHLDNNLEKTKKLLITLLAKRDQWLPIITLNASNPALRKQLESYLTHIADEALEQVITLFPNHLLDETFILLDYAHQNLQLLLQKDNIFATWLAIGDLLLTDRHQFRKDYKVTQGFPADKNTHAQTMKANMIALVNQLNGNEKLRAAFEKLRKAPPKNYPDTQWKILESLHFILRILAANLKITFQKHGKIDYIENAEAALRALGSDDQPTDIALALDYRIQHILVDEFQDTAYTQYRLLEKLTAGWEPNDGRTLFVVGDPMQSIYRFREAEVGFFIRARREGIGKIYLEPLTLSVNFRSTQEVVSWVNEHFNIIFPKEEDIATGAVTYSKSIAKEANATHSKVLLHAFQNEDSFHEQSNHILSLIQSAQQKKPEGSIAILVRTRSHLGAIIPTLKSANISFRAIDIDPLSTRMIIQDLMALTSALLFPEDRIAWLAVLRAPWAGLSLSDLLILAENDTQIIYESLLTTKNLSLHGEKIIARVLPILHYFMQERYRFPLRNWVESAWTLLGGPALLNNLDDLQDVEVYFQCLEKINPQEILSFDDLENYVEKLRASPDTKASNQLQIMTIHNAKGLEFDTVILPHLEKKPKNDDKQLILWMERPRLDHARDFLMASLQATGEKEDPIYQYIKGELNQKAKHEIARLLYVAVTRAKENCHLLFSMKDPEKNPDEQSLLGQLWPAVKNKITWLENKNTTYVTEKIETTRDELKRLSCDWQSPIQNITHLLSSEAHNDPKGFLLPDPNPSLIGTFIHQFLQKLAELGTDWWTNHDDIQKINYIEYHLLQKGIHKNDIPTSIYIVLKAIQNTLSDEKGQWILKKHTDAQCELSITTFLNNEPEILIIDRTFIDETGTRWIIDYKTTLSPDENKACYEKQLAQYRSALQQIEKVPIKTALYFPLLPLFTIIS